MTTNTPATTTLCLIACATLAAASLGFTATCHAEGTPDERTVTLEFVGASASTAQGAATLYRRIREAAQDVCSVLDHGDLSSKRPFRACVRATIEATVARLDRPAVTAAHDAAYPPSPTTPLLAIQGQ